MSQAGRQRVDPAGGTSGGTEQRAADRRRHDRRHQDVRRKVVEDVLAAGGPHVEFQPLLSLTRLEVAGYEALARFPDPPAGERRRAARPGGTEEWLAAGQAVGLGPQVEAAAVGRAVALGADRPAGTVLSVNLSPSSLADPHVQAALPDDLSGLEIELTEHEAFEDLAALRRQVDALRERGALVAVDDVGAGYAGLSRVMDLEPDTLKLDAHLVDGVATNRARAALVRAVVHLADNIGARVCAEGVERAADLVALADLDVARAQGWFVGRPAARPGPVEPAALDACRHWLDLVFAAGPHGRAAPSLTDVASRVGDVRTAADLGALAVAAAGVLGCSTALLAACAPEGGALNPVGADPAAGSALAPLLALAAGPAVRPLLLEGTAVPLYRTGHAERAALGAAGAALLVPVRSRGAVVGVLVLTLRREVPWTRRQINGARLVAAVLGPVLDALGAV